MSQAASDGDRWPHTADLVASAARLFSQGAALADEGQPEAAYARLVQAAACFNELPASAAGVECAWTLARVCQNTGRTQEALGRYAALLPIFDLAGEDSRAAQCCDRIAVCLTVLGRSDDALELHEQSRARFVALDDWAAVAHVDLYTGCVLTDLGRHAEALRRYDSARRLALRHDERRDVAWADLKAARALRALERPEEAADRALQAVAGFAGLGREERAADARVMLADAYVDTGRTEQALAAYEQALVVFVRSADARRTATVAKRAGLLLLQLGRCQEALAFFAIALDAARVLSWRGHEAACLDHMAVALGRLDRRAEAVRRRREARAIRAALEADAARLCSS